MAGPLSDGMKALTLWQPWASLIAEGVKTIETRSWPCPEWLVGETIAIHAAARKPRRHEPVGDWLPYRAGDAGPYRMEHYADGVPGAPHSPVSLPLGAVVATARLVDCVPMVGDDSGGAYFDPGPDLEPGQAHMKLVNGRAIHWWWDTDAERWDMAVRDDQLPFGDFAPGRWAWLLDEIEELPEPVPAKGRQKLWTLHLDELGAA